MATFVLVHGTYAKSADWPALQSALTDVAKLNGQDVRIEKIPWTGKNRAGARQWAAVDLFRLLLDIRFKNPNEKIFLIGHSHGGSAIVYFLKRYPNMPLAGCAFLSTPFVAIRERSRALVYWFYFFPVIAFMLLSQAGYWSKAPVVLPDISLIYVAFVLLVILGILARAIIPLFLPLHALFGTKDIFRLQTADIPNGNYLFLRCSGDEAAAALSAAQFIAWLGTKVSGIVTWLMLPILIITITCTAIFFAFGVRSTMPDAPYLRVVVFALFFCVGVAVPFLFFLCLVTASLIVVGQALTSRAFGWTDFFTGLFVELAIEPLPFGTHSLTHIDWNEGASGIEGIMHSRTYAHPAAVRRLQEWVNSTLKLQVD
ncbi:alpha/beta fold hydrolase [Bradyrhizobium sp. AUGA SZCCT0042]|uniref:alpha/beta fold hydrolase n=1 Tax=Bradyrhizobium sp. AUGA SZCCT0042 TaxID=2807651 RepID=UPI001BA44A85|nr:alpha/beta fold hydrolase [Bradyrhizobium sp. AUGA SZCCT0042]MBR1300068.1 hypothetical protein [Bradyrhizobium sp. AUGA SZCCT0042]